MPESAQIKDVGLGLRGPHVPHILQQRPPIPWFEILADNYLQPGGVMARQLDAVLAHYPCTFHCVGMSPGGSDDLDLDYLGDLRRLIERYEPVWVSDHVSFSAHGGAHYHDLLPLPYTEEALDHMVERVGRLQDFFGRQLLMENPSTYLRFSESTLGEAEFLNALCERSGCGLLIDVNNAHVNQRNHGDSGLGFLLSIEPRYVKQAHLGGYEDRGEYLLDAHNNPVSEPVWELFRTFCRRFPGVPVLVEWDNDIPEFEVLDAQRRRAEVVIAEIAQEGTSA